MGVKCFCQQLQCPHLSDKSVTPPNWKAQKFNNSRIQRVIKDFAPHGIVCLKEISYSDQKCCLNYYLLMICVVFVSPAVSLKWMLKELQFFF